jgi:ubiquinone/menaquinone biosynthesis C-methylase UbiE
MTKSSRAHVQQAYSKDPDRYDLVRLEDPRGALLSNHDRRIVCGLFPKADGVQRVLEVGAGTGRFTLDALEHGFKLIATDINELMLKSLREKLARAGREDDCEVRIADIFDLDFPDESFDFVFSLHVIPRFENLEDQEVALTEVARIVRPGGSFLFNYRSRKSFYNLAYRGFATPPAEIDRILSNASMRIVHKQGKWLLNRKLINRLPMFVGRGISVIDRALVDFMPDRAWDVFVVARKDPA